MTNDSPDSPDSPDSLGRDTSNRGPLDHDPAEQDAAQRLAAVETLVALRAVVPTYADPQGLALPARSIGNKWGFNDGDTPDPLYDMLFDWYETIPRQAGQFWRPTLWRLVNEHLVPAVVAAMDVALPRLSYMPGIHNPVRFADDDVDISILPDLMVHVPWLEVLARTVHAIEDSVTYRDEQEDGR